MKKLFVLFCFLASVFGIRAELQAIGCPWKYHAHGFAALCASTSWSEQLVTWNDCPCQVTVDVYYNAPSSNNWTMYVDGSIFRSGSGNFEEKSTFGTGCDDTIKIAMNDDCNTEVEMIVFGGCDVNACE